MENLTFEKAYDLSILSYTGMQMHPSEEAAGERVLLQTHNSPLHMPTMKTEKGGPEPGWPIHTNLQMTTHTGTHVDGGIDFNKYGKRIDEWPIDKFMGKAVVLDFRHLEDCYGITGDDLAKAEPKIEKGDILIINTGRHKEFGTTSYARKHPGIDGNKCEEFILDMGIKMIGIDTICVEECSEQAHWEHATHRICLINNEIPIIENLGGEIDAVTGKRCYIMALPLKLYADASPSRVIALL